MNHLKDDKQVYEAIQEELNRQRNKLEMIASENIVSYAVMEAQGSVLTNKYAEGYPGKRYYGGCEFVDKVEQLAIDRANESVAHLYDPCHPAVLRLIADTIAECNAQGKSISVCGEMAGDVTMTRLLLGLGLRRFSMHPSQILAVKQQILRADTAKLKLWAQEVLQSENPGEML